MSTDPRSLNRILPGILLTALVAVSLAAVLFFAPQQSEVQDPPAARSSCAACHNQATPGTELDDLRACPHAVPVADASAAPHSRGESEGSCSRVRGDGLPPRKPNPWFYNERAYPLGRIPLDRWRAARDQAVALRAQSPEHLPKQRATWVARGPTNVGGRVTDIAVHPTDANIVYAGAAEGGVLRSTNGGANWTPVFDDQSSIAIGALAIDPTNPDVVYAGTGEVNPGGGSVAYGGAGLFRSTDAGDTWTCIGLENTGSIGRIRVDPTDPDRIFVAAMGYLWEDNPERGVYRTTDGGATWELVHHVNSRTGCVDLIMRPDNPDVLLAATWERIRQPEYYSYGGANCGVYKTVDGGDNWLLVGGGLPVPNSNSGRIGLSLCASQPDVMHVIYADRIGYFDGLYRSVNGGTTWTQTNDVYLSNVFSSYGWWFGNVRTHPMNPDTIYVLGLYFYRSTTAGSYYSDVSGGMHVDHHALDFGPGANPLIYNGNDGGVYRSADGGSSWVKMPDLPITQIYRVALDANNPAALYCGTQDNGTNRTLTGALNDWDTIYWGDGFQPLVHPNNSNHIWAQYQYGSLAFSSNGGYSFGSASTGISYGDRFNWNSPLIQDPTDPDVRYFGTNRVYRSASSTSWTAVSPDLTGGVHQGNSGQVNGTLTTLAVSPQDGDVIWSGSDDGRVQVTENGGSSWTDVSAGLPERWVTAVRADPFKRGTAYVTLSGYRWAEPLARVYMTTDLGATWNSISGDLPDVPVNDLATDPDWPGHFFVATDLGVYETFSVGGLWNVLGTGLPNIVVTSLAFDSPNRVLVAGTYGRSFFSCHVGAASPAVPDIKVNGSDGPLTLTPADPVEVSIALDPGAMDGLPADWWVHVKRNDGTPWWCRYNGGSPKWTRSETPIFFAGATLRTVNGYQVLAPRNLPPGSFVWTFSLDELNGDLEETFFDTVDLTIN